ncbi:TPA: DUF3265 domain-containing protein [Vibrio parahaemolyticus]|nr:DUF3265 domain-containing protein [Vibrio parahaemolyticus]
MLYKTRLCRAVKNSVENCKLTSCLRGIHNAWHFYYALILVIKVVCSGFGIALFTPSRALELSRKISEKITYSYCYKLY